MNYRDLDRTTKKRLIDYQADQIEQDAMFKES